MHKIAQQPGHRRHHRLLTLGPRAHRWLRNSIATAASAASTAGAASVLPAKPSPNRCRHASPAAQPVPQNGTVRRARLMPANRAVGCAGSTDVRPAWAPPTPICRTAWLLLSAAPTTNPIWVASRRGNEGWNALGHCSKCNSKIDAI